MRSFKVVDLKTSQDLKNQYPQLNDRHYGIDDFKYNSRICIFDHFLNREDAIKLIDNVSDVERNRRDVLWSQFYTSLIERFDIYIVKYAREKLIFKSPRSKNLVLNRLNMMGDAGCVSFVVPELDIYYEQYWEDTHTVYYNDSNKLNAFKSIVQDSSLHWL